MGVCFTDNACFDGGDLVAAAGILVSATLALISLLKTMELGRNQNRLAAEQNELLAEQNQIARRQISGLISVPPAGSHGSSSVEAAFQVTLVSATRSSDRLVVRNVGSASAHNVEVAVEPPDDLVGGSPQDFPRIDPGQDWRLIFARSLGSPSRYHWTVRWRDDDGNEHETDGWVAPQ